LRKDSLFKARDLGLQGVNDVDAASDRLSEQGVGKLLGDLVGGEALEILGRHLSPGQAGV
jgi:hypothetical protein